MPNTVDSFGLTVNTVGEISADLIENLQAIYGSDINVSQNSPDGQNIGIFSQASADQLQLLVSVYNGFSVIGAVGTILDQRVANNGLFRREGTYTITPVSITTDRALNLIGLDALEDDPTASVFTVADDADNQFYLQETQVIAAPGTTSFSFRAVQVGSIETLQNTITNQITTVLGVTAVNNPSVATSTGVDEETDTELKIRHAKSFQLAATGPADAIEAALLSLASVTDAIVIENDTVGTVNDVPAHSVWCIVVGGTDEEVGTAIYSKKAPGCGMFGDEEYVVIRPDGNTFTAKFDRGLTQPLYIEFGITPRRQGIAFDEEVLKEQLAEALIYHLNQSASIGDVVEKMLLIAPNGILTGVGVSTDDNTFLDIVETDTPQYAFTVSAADITIS